MNVTKNLAPTGHDQAIVIIAPARTGDCVNPQTAEELKRRILVFTLKPQQQIVRSTQPPSDKTVYWLPVDENGKVTGVLQGYDPGSGTWIPISDVGSCISQAPDNLLAPDSNGCLYVAAGNVPGFCEITNETANPSSGAASFAISYAGFLDIDAEIGVNFLADPGADARWWTTDRSETGCTLNFAGLGGTVALKVFARRCTLPQ
jgi:hypothetical protein